jgi:predicted Fe-Mo cluster-binding NifX family protein
MKPNETVLIPAGIGKPALRALAAAGIKSLEDVARANEDDLLALHGVGPRAIRVLKAALKTRRSRGRAKPRMGSNG